jgi:hypothetical protein
MLFADFVRYHVVRNGIDRARIKGTSVTAPSPELPLHQHLAALAPLLANCQRENRVTMLPMRLVIEGHPSIGSLIFRHEAEGASTDTALTTCVHQRLSLITLPADAAPWPKPSTTVEYTFYVGPYYLMYEGLAQGALPGSTLTPMAKRDLCLQTRAYGVFLGLDQLPTCAASRSQIQ